MCVLSVLPPVDPESSRKYFSKTLGHYQLIITNNSNDGADALASKTATSVSPGSQTKLVIIIMLHHCAVEGWGSGCRPASLKNILDTISSVQFSCSIMSDSLRPHGLQHARPSCSSPTPRVYSNSCPLSW